MTLIQDLVSNVLNTPYERFDPATVSYAKIRIMDTLGAVIGAVNSSGADMAYDIVKTWGGKGEATIITSGDKVPAANAVFVMGIMARSNDYEPAGGPMIDGKKSPGHYSATSVPTAIAMAERLGLSGKDVITALILGDDMATRIGAAGAGPMEIIGWDPAGTCSRFGAAAIAGKLMGFNEKQMLNALGIVYTQIAGTMAPVLELTHSFKLSQGLAGWNGILSAELATKGFTGPQDPILGRYGYYQQYCQAFDESVLLNDLGARFYADEEFKLYPCCRGNAGSVETTLKIVQQHEIEFDAIEEVVVDLHKMMAGSFLTQPFEIGPCLQATGILNLRYNVASAILRKDAKLVHYTEAAIKDANIDSLAQKINVRTILDGSRLACRVTIRMKDGKTYTDLTDTPRGDFNTTPITVDEVRWKFEENAAFSNILSPQKTAQAIRLIEQLEDLDRLDELIMALTF